MKESKKFILDNCYTKEKEVLDTGNGHCSHVKEEQVFIMKQTELPGDKYTTIDMKPLPGVDEQNNPADNNDDEEDEHDDWDEDDDNDENETETNILVRIVLVIQTAVSKSYSLLAKMTRGYLVTIILLTSFVAYLIVATTYKSEGEGFMRLIICTVLGTFIATSSKLAMLLRALLVKMYGAKTLTARSKRLLEKGRIFFRWFMYAVMGGFMIYIVYAEAQESTTKLRSIPGLIIVLVICLLLSNNPRKINWHTIYVSVALQFLCAVLFLKWSMGRQALIWIQERLAEFFDNSKAGSVFLFGESYKDHYIVFGALPIILIMGSTMAVLYYVGAMQLVVKSVGSFLYLVLDTDPIESTCVAAGIFLEGVIAIISLKPFLSNLSKSELFVAMTSAFASLGGAYMGILVNMGIPLEYLLPAMMISAPATFTVCKLIFPETKKRKSSKRKIVFELEESNTILEAFQDGAVSMIPLLVNVVAIVFVFISCLSWLDNTLEWFGERVGVQDFNMRYIFSYLLYPVSLLMGIEGPDCKLVATLWGYRLTSANIIAFFKLIEMRDNREDYQRYMLETNYTGDVTYSGDTMMLEEWNKTLTGGMMSVRSEAIVTYSLCGLSGILSVAITIGVFITLLPKRRQWISKVPLQALIAGNIANLMSGIFASFFY